MMLCPVEKDKLGKRSALAVFVSILLSSKAILSILIWMFLSKAYSMQPFKSHCLVDRLSCAIACGVAHRHNVASRKFIFIIELY